ncbi:MAG: hypothetical protein GY832_42870 [Chloroflexi bacterium]|nr:hypothetical protein [Chloroflexota bacterium]
MLNQLLDQLGVKAVEHNGRNRLLDPIVQLLVLSDATPIVSRAVSTRVNLLLGVTHAIAVANRVVRSEVARLDSER